MKEEKLERLKKKIQSKIGKERTWFFNKITVQGFLGTNPVVFLALNPSKGNVKLSKNRFPTRWDRIFYSLLIKYGLENSHITDFIKVKMTEKEVKKKLKDERFLKRQLNYLLDEIKIIKPKIIVTMGGKCQNLVEKYSEHFKGYEIFEMVHYARGAYIGKKKSEKELEKDFIRLKTRLKKLKN